MKSKVSIILILSILFVALCPMFANAQAWYTITFTIHVNYVYGYYAGTTEDTTVTYVTKSPLAIYKVSGDYKTISPNQITIAADEYYYMKTVSSNGTTMKSGSLTSPLGYKGNFQAPFYGTFNYYSDAIKYSEWTGYGCSVSDNYLVNGKFSGSLVNGANYDDWLDANPNRLLISSPVTGSTITDIDTNLLWKLKGYDGYKLCIKYYLSDDGTNWNYAGIVSKYTDETFSTIEGEDWLSYTIYADELPWQNGYIRYDFIMYLPSQQPSDSTNIYSTTYQVNAQKSYIKIQKPSTSSVEIPVIKIIKVNYDAIIDYYINGVYYGTMKEKNLTKNVLPLSTDCQIGSNYITIKNKETGEEIMSDTFILTANEQGEIESNVNQDINEDGEKVDSSGKPIKPDSDDGIIDWIIYGINYCGWAVTTLGDSVSSIVTQTANFGSLVQVWFSYLPDPYTEIMVIAVSLGILLRIFNR